MARPDIAAPFLTEVWKQACQHIELADAAARILPHLAGALPLGQLVVRELEPARHAIETIAAAPAEPDATPARTELRADELEAILAWCRGGGSSAPRRARCGAGCPDCFRRAPRATC